MSFLYRNGACSNNRNRRSKHSRLRHSAFAAAGFAVLGLGVLPAQFLQAQERPPDSARQVVLDVAQRFEWSSNPDLATIDEERFTSRTSLDFAVTRRTRVDELSFSIGGDLELSDDDDETGFDRLRIALGWIRDVGRSRIRLAFDFTEVDLDSTTTIFNEDTGSIDFATIDNGSRETTNFLIEGAFGIDQPFGGSYRLEQRFINYNDVISTTLQDAERLRFDGEIFAAVAPTTRIGLNTEFIDFDEQEPNALDTKSTRFAGFIEQEFTPLWSGRFEAGWQRVEESGLANSSEEGVVLDLALTRVLPRSEITFEIESEISINGRRDTATIRQDFDLQRYNFGYFVGLTQGDDVDLEPLFGLNWTQELPRGDLTFDLSQRTTTGRDNEDLINTRLSLVYQQQLTNLSGFDVRFSVSDRNERADTGIDTRRFDLSVAYRREVARGWDFTTGVSLARLEEDGIEDRNDTTVFFGFEKQFVWN